MPTPKPALAGWLLAYVDYTILVLALRGLSLWFVLTGDIGILAGGGDFLFHFWTSVLLELMSLAVLILFWRRVRIARWAAVIREASVLAVLAAQALLFGPESVWWEIALAEAAAGAGWIAYLLRSRRAREYFASAP